jgi:selT/selW/selH-like putative selenoprotein
MEYSYHLQQRFPALQITADVMQPPLPNRVAAQVIGMVQICGFAVSFFGDQIFTGMSLPVPDWAKWLQENRGTAIGAFFLSNIISNSFTTTGAFEVYLGEEIVHSKIKTGIVPDFNTLVVEISKINPSLSMVAPPEEPLQRKIEHSSASKGKKRLVSLEDENEEL